MKKVFALLAIAGFVACNSGETKDAAADSARIADSTKKAQDSIAALTPAVDTTKKDSAAPAAADTAKPAAH